ncbi:hypothetical protein GCM10018779_32840 [Streptomyces griseocarneus]|nr:hypothetical protein GCM10018779_32840 [Streptomyces griseocarneus]
MSFNDGVLETVTLLGAFMLAGAEPGAAVAFVEGAVVGGAGFGLLMGSRPAAVVAAGAAGLGAGTGRSWPAARWLFLPGRGRLG